LSRYAVYGGVFIALSYAWGWAVDGDRPDTGDWVGASIAVAGVALAWFWPRGGSGGDASGGVPPPPSGSAAEGPPGLPP
jgi:hypothetical protein